MKWICHVTTPAGLVRKELHAPDKISAIKVAIAGTPNATSASARLEVPCADVVRQDLALRASSFPLIN